MIFGKATTDGGQVSTFDEPIKGDTGTKPSLAEVTYSIPADAIKVFEPTNKDPVDQLTTLVTQYEDMKKQGAPAANYAGAFDPKSDQFFVQTGNANVTQTEDLRSLFSTSPEILEEGPSISAIVLWLGVGFLAYKLYRKGK